MIALSLSYMFHKTNVSRSRLPSLLAYLLLDLSHSHSRWSIDLLIQTLVQGHTGSHVENMVTCVTFTVFFPPRVFTKPGTSAVGLMPQFDGLNMTVPNLSSRLSAVTA